MMKGLNFNGIGERCGPISMRSLVHHASAVLSFFDDVQPWWS